MKENFITKFLIKYNLVKILKFYMRDSIDADSTKLLIYALKNNANTKMLDFLLNLAVDINIKDADGNTPLIYTLQEGYDYSILKRLIKKGANINIQNNHGHTPINFIAYGSYDKKFIIKFLQNKPNLALATDNNENSILFAVKNQSVDIIKILTKHGADKGFFRRHDKDVIYG